MQFRMQDELLLADNLKSLILTNIKIFHQTKESMLSAAKLAKKHNITFYDSSYLCIAIKNDAKLLTYDKKLINAAVSEGIKLYN